MLSKFNFLDRPVRPPKNLNKITTRVPKNCTVTTCTMKKGPWDLEIVQVLYILRIRHQRTYTLYTYHMYYKIDHGTLPPFPFFLHLHFVWTFLLEKLHLCMNEFWNIQLNCTRLFLLSLHSWLIIQIKFHNYPPVRIAKEFFSVFSHAF